MPGAFDDEVAVPGAEAGNGHDLAGHELRVASDRDAAGHAAGVQLAQLGPGKPLRLGAGGAFLLQLELLSVLRGVGILEDELVDRRVAAGLGGLGGDLLEIAVVVGRGQDEADCEFL